MIRLEKYTVTGIDGATGNRYIGYFHATDPDNAEKQACMINPDLMIASVFDGHIGSVDRRAYAIRTKKSVTV